jgi:hypothetical protein
MSLLTPTELSDSYGGTGTFTAAEVQMAIDLAEFDIADALNTPLTPTTFTEEYMWPLLTSKIMLMKQRVTSITTVTAKHSLDADCVWTEDTECGVILDSLNGIIRVVGCNLSLGDCECPDNIMPDRAVITYVAGFTAAETDSSTSLGKMLRMAIALQARVYLGMIGDGEAWQGEYTIESWNSMDYGERRKFGNVLNPLGPSHWSAAAWNILSKLKSKPAIFLRSPERV